MNKKRKNARKKHKKHVERMKAERRALRSKARKQNQVEVAGT